MSMSRVTYLDGLGHELGPADDATLAPVVDDRGLHGVNGR
jgi:hypothetical protein